MLKIYTMNVSGIDTADEGIYESLSERRREKVKKLKNERAKKQSIGAELLLITAVSEETGKKEAPVKWDCGEFGNPYLADYPDIHINIAHSGDYAVCAVSDTEIGTDIQYMREFNEAVMRRCFTAEETELVKSAADKKDAFYDLWVRKESFAKAVGRGLLLPLNEISVINDRITYDGNDYSFIKQDFNDKMYKLCLCKCI